MSDSSHKFKFAIQSTCLIALLDSRSGQVFYIKSPGFDTIPVREQKMLSVIANSEVYARMSSDSEVSIKEALGSAIHILWKELSPSVNLAILGALEYFGNPSASGDLGVLLSTTCEFLFGNVLEKEDACSLRLQHRNITVFGNVIDFLFLHNGEDTLPLTHSVSLVETESRAGTSEGLIECMNCFCESVNAIGGLIFCSGRVLLISSHITELMNTPQLRSFVILCTVMSELAVKEDKRAFFDSPNFTSLDVLLTNKKDKVNISAQAILSEIPFCGNAESNLFGVFLFDTGSGDNVLPENLSSEVVRYWSTILMTHFASEPPSLTEMAMKVIHQILETTCRNSTLSKLTKAILPLSICVANSHTNLAVCYSSEDVLASNRDKIVALVKKAFKHFSSYENPQQQALSRCPSALCFRYVDNLSIAISRPPINVFAVLPADCPHLDGLNFIAEVGLEIFFKNRHVLCN